MTRPTAAAPPPSLVRVLRGAAQTLLIVLAFVALGTAAGWLGDARRDAAPALAPLSLAAAGNAVPTD